jgi:hypothetical protein
MAIDNYIKGEEWSKKKLPKILILIWNTNEACTNSNGQKKANIDKIKSEQINFYGIDNTDRSQPQVITEYVK